MDISIIVPTLNEGAYIDDCLGSIYSQNTGLDYEVIVSDGSSTDGTLEIAEGYGAKTVVSELRSTSIQRNLGAEKARANHLLFVDADTQLSPNYLDMAARKFAEDEELIGFSAGFLFSKRQAKLIFAEKVTNSYFMFRDRISSATLPGFNFNIRRKVFSSLGGFRNVPLEDVDMSIELRKVGKTRYFMDFFVITSPRRLDRMGLMGSVKYYVEMDMTRKSPVLAPLFRYSRYVSCRVSHTQLQEGFARALGSRILGLEIDEPIHRYIYSKTDTFAKAVKQKTLATREQLADNMEHVSRSLADIGLGSKVGKADVDRALKIMQEKIKIK